MSRVFAALSTAALLALAVPTAASAGCANCYAPAPQPCVTCYQQQVVPPQYRTVDETVMVSPGRRVAHRIPARYETVMVPKTVMVAPEGVQYAVKIGTWPYDLAKAKQLMTEAGFPNGFETELWSAYNHTTAQKVTQFLQQQLQQIGIRTKITLLEAGQRVEKVESWQDPATAPVRLYYVGWSTSTGEADWALRPLLYGESWPPRLFNTAYYKNPKVDADIKGAQLTTDSAEKAKLYKDAQETIWKDAPWAPLVVEKLLSAHSKKLSGVYVIPDASFNFTEVDLKP